MSAEPEAPAPRLPRAHWLVWVFAAIGLLGILAVFALAALLYDVSRPYRPAKVAGATPETVFTIGGTEELAGTDLIRIHIRAEDGRGGSGSYSGREDLRNIVLLDKRNGASRKLLPDNRRRIDASHFLPARAGAAGTGDDALMGADPKGQDRAPPAHYVLVVTDSEEGRPRDVLVGTLSTGSQAYVMRGLDGVDSIWMQSGTQIGFLVRERLALYYRIVDVPTGKVVVSKRVAID